MDERTREALWAELKEVRLREKAFIAARDSRWRDIASHVAHLRPGFASDDEFLAACRSHGISPAQLNGEQMEDFLWFAKLPYAVASDALGQSDATHIRAFRRDVQAWVDEELPRWQARRAKWEAEQDAEESGTGHSAPAVASATAPGGKRCCVVCGAVLDARRSTRRFCSTRCRVAAHRMR